MFKYYSISDRSIVDNLIGEKCSIKFSSASTLNDPNELKFNFKVNYRAKKTKEDFFKSNPNKDLKDFREWQEMVSRNPPTGWSQRSAANSELSLSSFSLVNDNNLMWSHYTNVHKGICVGYKNELKETLRSLASYMADGAVKYTMNPPTISNMEDYSGISRKMIFNKQSEWKYEKEYRFVVKSKNSLDFFPISTDLISAVYIGSRTEPELESLIIQICLNYKIPVFHAITMGEGYRIDFREHKEGQFYMKSFW